MTGAFVTSVIGAAIGGDPIGAVVVTSDVGDATGAFVATDFGDATGVFVATDVGDATGALVTAFVGGRVAPGSLASVTLIAEMYGPYLSESSSMFMVSSSTFTIVETTMVCLGPFSVASMSSLSNSKSSST